MKKLDDAPTPEEKQAAQEEQKKRQEVRIRKDMGGADESEVQKRITPQSFRQDMLSTIHQKRRDQLTEELEPEEKLEAQDDEPEEDPKEEPEEPEMVEVKVRGDTITVSQQEIDEAGGMEVFRKTKAADSYLEESKKRLQEVAELQRSLETKESEESEDEEKEDDEPPQLDDSLTDDEEAKLRSMEETYDQELVDLQKQVFMLQKALAKGLPQSREDVADKAAEKAFEKLAEKTYEKEEAKANDAFKEKYPHIQSDQGLRTLTQLEVDRLLDEDPNQTLKDVFLKAAETIHSKYTPQVGAKEGSEKEEDPPDTELVERKRKHADSVPQASARMQREPEKRPPTPSEVIAKMRKARQQPDMR